MSSELSEITFVLIAGTLLFVFLIFILIAFFLIYQKRKTRVEEERRQEREFYEKEIRNAQTEIREETMRFISQELHDNISQILTVTHLNLNRLDIDSPILRETQASLQDTITQIRLLSKALNTDNLIEAGLIQSMNFEVDRLRQIKRWNIDFFIEVSEIPLSGNTQLLLFRVFQELMTNIIKHSQAENIFIELSEENNNYKLTIADDGNQYDFHQKAREHGFNKGSGLKNVLKRIEMLKGEIRVRPNPSKGMTTLITIPKIQ